jgi:hypothetical protein
MVDQSTFYEEQAEICARAAAEATLPNERDKFLQAQAAWKSLAEGRAFTQAAAAKREAERRVSAP